MLVAQASDLHLRADPAHSSHVRFARLLDHLTDLKPLPDLLVLSGDLADDGEIESYRHLRTALGRWPGALRLTAGNHDDRVQLLRVFPEMGTSDGFVQSTAEFEHWRLILIDTLAPGKTGGEFCAARADWLIRALRERCEVPALIVLHHPPCDVGLDWIDPGKPDWAALLAHIVEPYDLAGFSAGHLHTAACLEWRGHRLVTCPAVASDLSLNFAPLAQSGPDGRALIERSTPGFCLHRWQGGRLATYFGRCPDVTLDYWDAKTRCVVDAITAEREGSAR